MSKIILKSFLLIIIFFLCFISCKTKNIKYPKYKVRDNIELGCIELVYEDITYRPYSILTLYSRFNKYLSKQIGIREDNYNSKIYELIGYDSREWIYIN